MSGAACREFLSWALPKLRLRAAGFRRVRRQVCRRIGRRIQELGLPDPVAYRQYIEAHEDEWSRLDAMCRITVSRFGRDRGVFEFLGSEVLPTLASAALARGDGELRGWSAGCASGEEPYSLRLLWDLELHERFPSLRFTILATDADSSVLERARAARYRRSSLKELPARWIDEGFCPAGEWLALRPSFRHGVDFQVQDVRRAAPEDPFDLVLCRNLVCTYFDTALQREALLRLVAALRSGGALVIGLEESLPETSECVLDGWAPELNVFRKR